LKKNALAPGNRWKNANVSRGRSFSSSIDFQALTVPPLAATALPVLRRLPPETAHALALCGLRLGLAGRDTSPPDPALAQTLLGLHFPNPIGLAAGFDKNAVALAPLMALGFGFIEAGTVTPRGQPGNPRPRLFRLPAERALINRMGFPGDGLAAFCARLARLGARPVPLGANIGLNKEGAQPARDFAALVARLAPLVDYITLNVSSPNTPGLRDLQAGARLSAILAAIRAETATPPPLFVKLAPDLDREALREVVATCCQGGVSGLIIANTTLARPPGLRGKAAGEAGGLSGPPLMARATLMLAATAQLLAAHRATAGEKILIGCGGITSGADVLAKIRAGAHLVQLYTAFVYDGAALIPRLRRDLATALREGGFATLEEARGVDAARLAESAWNI